MINERAGIYCPHCGAGTNSYGVWLGYGKIKCLRCKKMFSVLKGE